MLSAIPVLETQHLEFSYHPSQPILHDINLSIRQGDRVAIIGNSGSGKSTLLKVLSGALSATKGCIINNPDDIGFMFQDSCLLPWLNVIDNISMGARIKKQSYQASELDTILEKLNLTKLTNQKINKLSGGQKQRVALARLLLAKTKILFLDESFSSLDIVIKEKLYQYILQITKQKNLTLVLVTHDLKEALKLADKVVILNEQTKSLIAYDNNHTRNNEVDALTQHYQQLN